MALLLYLIVALLIAAIWSRFVQRVSVAAAIALIALPLVFTGRAMLTNRVYAPLDLPFTAEPLRDYARDFGVEHPHDIALSDLHCQIIPWQKAVRYALLQGEWPLWNPFILCGDILAGAAQPAVYDPIQFIGFLLALPDAVTFGAAMTFFLAAFFTFAFARAHGLGEIASLVAAAGYTFCAMMAFFVAWPLARAWAYLPLVLYGTHRVVKTRCPVVLGLAFVLVIVSGHPESVLHIVAIGAVYGIALKPDWRAILLAIGAGIAALALTAVYLLPFADAAPETLEYMIRRDLYAPTSYDVIVSPETRRERMLRTFVPFHGGPPSTPGWDPLSARVGILVMLLALGALFVAPRRSWPWALLAIVCLLATFGMKPVAHALHALPLFDIAINERLAFAAAFAMSMLAAICVDRIEGGRASRPLAAGILPDAGSADADGRDARRKRARRPPPFALIILALVLIERAYEDGSFYPALPKRVFYPRVPLIEAIPRDARMAGAGAALIPNNAALYELEDARGYNAMTFRRLYETYPLWSTYQRAWFNRIDDLGSPFLSFLNVRSALADEHVAVPDGWTVRATDRHTRLLENTRVLPRAIVPRRVRYVRANPVEDMKSVTDFSDIAWIETSAYEPHDAPNGPGRVHLHRVGLEYHLDATMDRPGWIVIAETAWPGWRAYIDGRRAPTHYANHAFLGVHVSEGRHQVRLVYLPEAFTRGRAISGIALVMLIGGALASRRLFGRRPVATVCYRARTCSPSSSTSPSASH